MASNVLHVPPGRLQENLAVPVAAHVLAQKVETPGHTRDAGFLGGEFETPLFQEVCHERLHFVTEKFLRRAGDDEVIRVADQMDLVLPALRRRGGKTLRQQALQPIQGPIRQGGGRDAPLGSTFRGGEPGVFLQEAGLEPLPEYRRPSGRWPPASGGKFGQSRT